MARDSWIKLLMDRSLPLFLGVGLLNTALNWAIMLGLHGRLGCGYWESSAVGYTITGALSFILNRKLSFASRGPWQRELPRFVLVVALCYLIGNGVAKPAVQWALGIGPLHRFSGKAEAIALIFGNVIFTALNYFGQRFFVFGERRSQRE